MLSRRNFAALVVLLSFLFSVVSCSFPDKVKLEVVVENCMSLLEHLQSPLVSKIILKQNLICDWTGNDGGAGKSRKFQQQIRIKHKIEISSRKQQIDFLTIKVFSQGVVPAILVSKGGQLSVNRIILELENQRFQSNYKINTFAVEQGGKVQIMNSMILFQSNTNQAQGVFKPEANSPAPSSMELDKTVFLDKSKLLSENVILCRSILGYKNHQSVNSIAWKLLQSLKPVKACLTESETGIVFNQGTHVVAIAARIGLLALFFTSFQVLFGVIWRRLQCPTDKEKAKEEQEEEINQEQSIANGIGLQQSSTCFHGISESNKSRNRGSSAAEIPKIKNKGNEASPDIGQGLLLELESVLGQGKCTRVFKGSYYGKAVAVKVTERIGSRKQAVSEPLEVKILRHLRHPNVVGFITSVKYVPYQDSSPCSSSCSMTTPLQSHHFPSSPRGTKFCYQTFLVMEYCDRGTLYEAIKQCRVQPTNSATQFVGMTMECVIHCAIDISRAMERVHFKRVVHRALHPKNILLQSNIGDPRGFICKVGGFGSSYRLSSGSSSIQDNKVKDIAIAAPEVLSGGQLSLASDVYAFGVVLYALYTNWMPFHNLSNNELRRTVLSGMRPTIPERVPPLIAELIRSCWATHPYERPSFTNITLKLEEFLRIERVRSMKDQSTKSGDSAGLNQKLAPVRFSNSSMEALVPGNSYIHIQFHPSKSEKPPPQQHQQQSRKPEYLPRHSKSLSDANYLNKTRRTVGKQRSTSVLPETREEAFVRSVDDLLKRSRSSDSKNELRQFLSTITLDCDAKYNHFPRDY
eukprot:g1337.t1